MGGPWLVGPTSLVSSSDLCHACPSSLLCLAAFVVVAFCFSCLLLVVVVLPFAVCPVSCIVMALQILSL